MGDATPQAIFDLDGTRCVFPWASNWVVFGKLHEVSFELHESQKDRVKKSCFPVALELLQS